MASRHPWNRLLAWLIDWVCILAWVAIVAAIGVPLYLTGAMPLFDAGVENLFAFILIIAPITLALGWRESSVRQATPGKRVRRLIVVSAVTGGRIRFGRALARNALKIALPWEFGHTVTFTLAASGGIVPPWIVPVAALTYALPIVYVVTLFVGDGRTLYDRIAGTVVTVARQ
jgi:uncharacterized RDD family membrane protein YckC